MAPVTRRFFLLSFAALSAGCSARRALTAAAAPAPRQPAVGQIWRYAKHDLFSRSHVDTQVDRVAAVGGAVSIDSSSTAVKTQKRPDPQWLQQYLPRDAVPSGGHPSEVQDPWGMILVDPHWGPTQVYEVAIPLWPAQLQPGWRTRIRTRYHTPGHQDALQWNQQMRADGWEAVTVPAGRFIALRFTNLISFVSGDTAQSDCTRQETLWFAPEVGRWVARESRGNCFADDSANDTPNLENSFRWELLEWS